MIKNKGFTLVEIIVAMGVGTFVLAAIYVTVNYSQKASSGIERKVIAQQDVRSALNIMGMEIRMASYDSNRTNDLFWLNPNDCRTPTGNTLYRGIQAAGPSSLSVEMDIFDTQKNPLPVPAPQPFGQNSNEIITYSYDATNLCITRNTNCGGPQSFLGETSAEAASGTTPRTVEVVNGAANIPLFRYYDANNTQLFPDISPTTDIPKIRIIEITLVVDTADPDPTIKAKRRMVYSTRVIPRNHFRNPYPTNP
jgi:prepilin-type N-terminal cleavage/methylation domain-containing protein